MNESSESAGDPGTDTSRDRKTDAPPYRFILLIGSILFAWAALLAAGAVWSGDAYRRAIVILASMSCFLAVWAVALWFKKKRS
ncbi:MAG: hypothetical protein VYE64_11820 [Planctomycetota bacterium]|nr:hypothetical protein [Planctomycetota bacterium]